MHFFWFIFSTTHTEKGHVSQILFPGRIYYDFVPYNISEGECTEDLRHVMIKLGR